MIALMATVCLMAAALSGPATAGSSASDRTAMGAQHRAGPLLKANLSGAKETPPGGDPNGRGHVAIRLHPLTKKVCANARYRGIGTPNAAHIHRGGPGVAGDVVVDLTGSVTGGAHCVTAPRKLIRKIALHPKRYYFNIHTGAFPSGAIRGQLHRVRV
jgi:hypothetical protein